MPGPFTYNDTPQASQKINATQPLIQQNFASTDSIFAVNHVGIDVSGDDGMHNIITMPVTTAATTTTANYANLYFKTPAKGAALETVTLTSKEICLKKSADQGIPITAFTASPDDWNATTGWAYLPSGLLMKWGYGTFQSSPNNFVDFPSGASIPAFTKIYNVQLTALTVGISNAALSIAANISVPTITRFYYAGNITGNFFYWFALGKGY